MTAAGANGFAPRKSGLEELLSVLRSARPGTMTIAPSVLPAARAGEPGAAANQLTARESHVLALMSRGASAAEVARVLSVSLNTNQTYIRCICGKLGVRTARDAVVRARQTGALAPAH